jgi:hypothetical protein
MIDGTLTWLDVPSRQASFEFISPKNGHRIEMTSAIPPTCDIRINGRPAKLTELNPGDKATIKVVWDSQTKSAQPHQVHVERPEAKGHTYGATPPSSDATS